MIATAEGRGGRLAGDGHVGELPFWTSMLAYGVRVGIAADTAIRLEDLKSMMPVGSLEKQCPVMDVVYGIRSANKHVHPGLDEVVGYIDGEEVVRVFSYASVLRTLERHVKLYVAECAPRRVFIHAGVVAWRGRGILMPGRTCSGKSTLVAAWLRAGATYYSDEFAIVDRSGRVHPYPQPLQLRNETGFSTEFPAAEFGADVGRQPLKVGLVLISRHRNGARWRPMRVSAGEGMLSLLANTVSARRAPHRALHNLNRLLAESSVVKGIRGEAEVVVRNLIHSGYLR